MYYRFKDKIFDRIRKINSYFTVEYDQGDFNYVKVFIKADINLVKKLKSKTYYVYATPLTPNWVEVWLDRKKYV